MATARLTARQALLGKEIVALRARSGVSRDTLATAIGVTRGRIAALEAGGIAITAEELDRLLTTLRLTDPQRRAAIMELHGGSTARNEPAHLGT